MGSTRFDLNGAAKENENEYCKKKAEITIMTQIINILRITG
jgi:hypothetical protein